MGCFRWKVEGVVFFNYPGDLKYFYFADGSYSSRATIHSHIIVWIELVIPACLTMCWRR